MKVKALNDNVLMYCKMHEEIDNGGLIEPTSSFDDIQIGSPLNENYGKKRFMFSKRVSIEMNFKKDIIEGLSKQFNIPMEDLNDAKLFFIKRENLMIELED